MLREREQTQNMVATAYINYKNKEKEISEMSKPKKITGIMGEKSNRKIKVKQEEKDMIKIYEMIQEIIASFREVSE